MLGFCAIGREFPWTMVVANVTQPIFGIDFLSNNKLSIDCANDTLFDPLTARTVQLQHSDLLLVSYLVNDVKNVDPRVTEILNKYPILTFPLQLSNSNKSPATQIYHHINTGNHPPVATRARPLTGMKLQAAKSRFQFLQNTGIVRRSNSPW